MINRENLVWKFLPELDVIRVEGILAGSVPQGHLIKLPPTAYFTCQPSGSCVWWGEQGGGGGVLSKVT